MAAIHQRSDVDVAVVVDHAPLSLEHRSRFVHDLQALFPDRDVDLAVLVSPPFASRIAVGAGLRHRLVHDYDEIDPRGVHEALPAAMRDIPEYLHGVHEHVDRVP